MSINNYLSSDVTGHIFSMLYHPMQNENYLDLLFLMLVCKKWNEISKEVLRIWYYDIEKDILRKLTPFMKMIDVTGSRPFAAHCAILNEIHQSTTQTVTFSLIAKAFNCFETCRVKPYYSFSIEPVSSSETSQKELERIEYIKSQSFVGFIRINSQNIIWKDSEIIFLPTKMFPSINGDDSENNDVLENICCFPVRGKLWEFELTECKRISAPPNPITKYRLEQFFIPGVDSLIPIKIEDEKDLPTEQVADAVMFPTTEIVESVVPSSNDKKRRNCVIQ